jgi:hypothetical protein
VEERELEGKLQRLARFHGNAVMSGSKKGFGLAGFVALVVGGSIVALTVWLAHVSWVIAALVGLAVLFVFYAWGAYREWDKADRSAEDADNRRRQAESALEGARRLAVNAPPAVNPDEYKPHHAESGEFPDSKALTFGFDHMTDHPGAYAALSPRRCTVTTPSGVTTIATRANRYFQYPQEFENAPPVRPGLYLFKLEGQLTSGEWAFITSGEHEVQPPPKTGLEVVIEDEKPTPFPGAATVLEIEFRVTNHDPVPHLLRKSIRGLNRTSFPPPDDPDLIAARREEHAIHDRRRRNGDELPPRVQPGETVRGVYVTTFPWDPTGTFPEYTLIIRDERQPYTARPHGAAEDPLAAWPIT